jgi:hypothetical protein
VVQAGSYMAAKKKPSVPAIPKGEHTAAVEARIEHIADLMRSLTFVTGKTVRELAQAWGLCEQRVRELSAEASKRVRAEVCAPRAGKRDVMVALDMVIRDGLTPMGDRKSAVQALKLKADLLGLTPPKRTELTGKGGEPLTVALDLSKLSDAELEALARPSGPPGEGGARASQAPEAGRPAAGGDPGDHPAVVEPSPPPAAD